MTKTTVKHFRIVDLFAGIGGLRNGVVQAIEDNGDTAKVVFTSEIKKAAIETLKANHPNEVIHGDITKISEKDIPEHDILIAGFPCQAFSYAGKRQGFLDSTKGTLFFDVERILKLKQPEYFILENVEGLITHNPDPQNVTAKYGRTLTTILGALKSLGYQTNWKLLTASEFGVPQARKRIFIVGSRSKPANLPEKTTTSSVSSILQTGKKDTNIKVKAFSELLLKHYTIKDLEGKVVRDKRGGPNNIHSWNIEAKGSTTTDEKNLMEILSIESRRKTWATKKGVPYRDGMCLSVAEISTFFTPTGVVSVQSMLENLTSMNYLLKENNEYRICSGRLTFPIAQILHPDKPAPTLVATDADRIGVIDGNIIRRLNDVEIKRLFGFPDSFVIPKHLTRRQVFDIFGNSVVSPVAKEVAETLIYK